MPQIFLEETKHEANYSFGNANTSLQLCSNNIKPHISNMDQKKNSNLFRAQLLFLLAVQNTSVILVTHYASHKVPGQESTYSVSTAIFCVELLKCLICVAVICHQKGLNGFIREIEESVIKRPHSFLALSIPSFLYVIQNNLNMVAIGNLPPAIYGCLPTKGFLSCYN